MRFMLATYAPETAQISTPISLPYHGLSASRRVLPLVRPFHRSAMRAELMDIIAGQSFTPMGSGGQLTSARATNVPPCRPITLAIIPPTASNSVAAATLWSNLDPLPDQSTSWPIPCLKSGEKLQERMSNSPSTGFLPAI